MTGLNHTTTGVLIALVAPHPAIGLLLAVVSHFILDSVPHWGHEEAHGSNSWFRKVVLVDAIFVATFLIVMLVLLPHKWPWIIAGGFLATAPDIMWLPAYVRETRKIEPKPHNAIMKFHQWIQIEKPWGVIPELIWLSFVGVLLVHVVKLY
jgi:hypothetical protein